MSGGPTERLRGDDEDEIETTEEPLPTADSPPPIAPERAGCYLGRYRRQSEVYSSEGLEVFSAVDLDAPPPPASSAGDDERADEAAAAAPANAAAAAALVVLKVDRRESAVDSFEAELQVQPPPLPPPLPLELPLLPPPLNAGCCCSAPLPC